MRTRLDKFQFIAMWHPDVNLIIMGKNLPINDKKQRNTHSIQHYVITSNSDHGFVLDKCPECLLQRSDKLSYNECLIEFNHLIYKPLKVASKRYKQNNNLSPTDVILMT